MIIYVTNPQFLAPTANVDELVLCYSIAVWVQGMLAVIHPPCNDDTSVIVAYGDSAVAIQQKIVANILATVPGSGSNDIVFIGAWT